MVSEFSLNPLFPGPRCFGHPFVQITCVLNQTSDTFPPICITSSDVALKLTVEFNALSLERYSKRMQTYLLWVRQIHRLITCSGVYMEKEPSGAELNDIIDKSVQNGQHFVGMCAVPKVDDDRSMVVANDDVLVLDASVIRSTQSLRVQ